MHPRFLAGRRTSRHPPVSIGCSTRAARWPQPPYPAFLADGKGRILHANPLATALLARPDKTSSLNLSTKIHEALASNEAQHVEVVLSASGEDAPRAALNLFLLPFQEEGFVFLFANDVTLDRNLREALIESRQRYKDLVETASDFVWETAADGAFTFVSSKGALGFEADELLGKDPANLLFDVAETEFSLPFRATREMEEVELWFRDAGGNAACLSISARPLFDETGAWQEGKGGLPGHHGGPDAPDGPRPFPE